MSRIFISYRRSDSISEAGRIYDYLTNHFGRASIFKDVDDIDAGDDFRDRVTQAVGHCQILLAIIGKSWLHATDTVGNRRLENPADWVRLEIETALNRKIRVIPVLLTGVEMPAVQALPTALQPLAYRNAARVRHDPDFRRDMERIVEVVERHFDLLAQQPSAAQAAAPAILSGSVASRLPRNKLNVISRRRAMKVLGFTGGGLSAVLIGRQLFQPKTKHSKIVRFNTVTVNDNGDEIRQEKKQARVFQEQIGEVPLDMVWVPGGAFTIGSPESEDGRGVDEDQPDAVTTIQPFLMGRYEVTQAQWRAVAALDKIDIGLKANQAYFSNGGDNRPVENVSWLEAVEFCKRLSDYTGRGYRLPSESEWEYACRAGTEAPFHFGDTLSDELANYDATKGYQNEKTGKNRETTTNVGNFPANAFGLYDMHGNVWEWCADHVHSNYEGAPTDGSPWLSNNSSSKRIMRGGSWNAAPWLCRSAVRVKYLPEVRYNTVGFRVSCDAPRTLL